MIKRKVDNFFLLSIFILITTFVVFGQYRLINVFFLLLCSYLLITDRKLLILIYVITLPTDGFISTEYNLFGILHVLYIINLFATIAVLLEWKAIPDQTKNILRKPKGFKKDAYWLILFLFLYLVLTDFRLSILGIEDISERHLVTRPIKYFVMFYPLLMLTKLSEIKKYKYIIKKGFIISVGLIAIGIIFSEQFSQLGFDTREATIFVKTNVQSGDIRRAGFFRSLGDVNSASGFMVVSFGFILFLESIKKNTKIMLIIITSLAIIETGSRAGVGSLLLVFIIYFIWLRANFKQNLIYISIIVLTGIAFFHYGIFDPILDRFSALQTSYDREHFNPEHELGRLGGWLFYLDYIIKDIKVFLFGTTEDIYRAVGWYTVNRLRVAHNFYIQLWYFWGVIPVIILLSIIFHYFKNTLRSNNKYLCLAILAPFIFTLMFVSDTGVFLAFIVALISINIEERNKVYEK